MKVLCVIDHFGSGGAQRQLANLACGLKGRGHDVEVFVYFPEYDFFRGQVEAAGIPIHACRKGKGFSLAVLGRLIGLIRGNRYEVVVSYLASPNVYAEMASRFARSRYVVSERSSHHGDKSPAKGYLKRHLHRWADCVVANSVSHRVWLQEHHGWIREKCATIYNGIDGAFFGRRPASAFSLPEVRLIAVGRIGPEKNLLNLIRALARFRERHGWSPSVSWVGRRADGTPEGREYCRQVDALLESHPAVERIWTWMGERSDVPDLLASHHALIHPSFYEGLPNVVCEALAAGLPVLASDVCDNGLLVPDGDRGLLFDPASPDSMAGAMERFAALGEDGWARLSRSARRYAGEELTIDRMVGRYEELFGSLVAGRSP